MAKSDQTRKYLVEFITKGAKKTENTLEKQLALAKSLNAEFEKASSAIDFAQAEQKARVFNGVLDGQSKAVRDLIEQFNGLKKAQGNAFKPPGGGNGGGGGAQRDDAAFALQSFPSLGLRGDPGGNLGSIVESLGELGGAKAGLIAAAILGLGALGNEVRELEGEFQDLMLSIARYSDLTQKEMAETVSSASALSKVFGETTEDILSAARSVSKNLNKDFRETFDLIEKGFLNGANAGGKFLETLTEYSVQFDQARVSAEDFVRVATIEAQEGVYNDRLSDAVKEFGLRIRELSSAQEAALAPLGRRFVSDLTQNINEGSLSAIDGLRRVYEQSVALGLSQRELQTITADLGAEALEDIGGIEKAYDLLTKAQELNLDSLDALGRRQSGFLERQKELTRATDDLAKSTEGASEMWDIFTKSIGSVLIRTISSAFNGLSSLKELITSSSPKPTLFAPSQGDLASLDNAIAKNEKLLNTLTSTEDKDAGAIERATRALEEQKKIRQQILADGKSFSRTLLAQEGLLRKIDKQLGGVANEVVFTNASVGARILADDAITLAKSFEELRKEGSVPLISREEVAKQLNDGIKLLESKGGEVGKQAANRFKESFDQVTPFTTFELTSDMLSGLTVDETTRLGAAINYTTGMVQDLLSAMVPTNEELLNADKFFMDLRHEISEYAQTVKDAKNENDALSSSLLQGQEKRVGDVISELATIDREIARKRVETANLMERRRKELSLELSSKDLGIVDDIIKNVQIGGLEARVEGAISQLEGRRGDIIGLMYAELAEAERQARIRSDNTLLSFVRSQVETYTEIGEEITVSNVNIFKSRYDKLIEDSISTMGTAMSKSLQDRLDAERNMYFATLDAVVELREAEEVLEDLRAEAQDAEIKRQQEILDLRVEEIRLRDKQAMLESNMRQSQSKLNQEESKRNVLFKLLGFSFIDETRRQMLEEIDMERERLSHMEAYTRNIKDQKDKEYSNLVVDGKRRIKELSEQSRAEAAILRKELDLRTEEAAGQASLLGTGALGGKDAVRGSFLIKQRESLLSQRIGAQDDPLRLDALNQELVQVNKEIVELYRSVSEGDGVSDEAIMSFKKVEEAQKKVDKSRRESAREAKKLEAEVTLDVENAASERQAASIEADNAINASRDFAVEQEKLRQEALKSAILSTVSLAVDSYREITAISQREAERQIEIQEDRIEKLKERDKDGRNAIDKGNAEQLQREEERLDRLAQERSKFVERQQALDLLQFASKSAVAIANAAATAPAGVLAPVVIATVLGAIAGGVAQIAAISNQVPGGVEGFEKGGKVRGGEKLIRINERGEEYVVNAGATRRSERLLKAINAGLIDDNVLSSMLTLTPTTTKGGVNQHNPLRDEVKGLRTDFKKMAKKKTRAFLDPNTARVLSNNNPKHNRRGR